MEIGADDGEDGADEEEDEVSLHVRSALSPMGLRDASLPMTMTVHTMRTTMLPPRSRKARQEVRAAKLRVSPDAGKCGKGHAQQTIRCGNAGTVAEPFHQY